jgi:hypothetical protein
VRKGTQPLKVRSIHPLHSPPPTLLQHVYQSKGMCMFADAKDVPMRRTHADVLRLWQAASWLDSALILEYSEMASGGSARSRTTSEPSIFYPAFEELTIEEQVARGTRSGNVAFTTLSGNVNSLSCLLSLRLPCPFLLILHIRMDRSIVSLPAVVRSPPIASRTIRWG